MVIIFYVCGLAFSYALWCYAKAKGYWGILGIGLAFLGIIGLIILLALPDKRKDVKIPKNKL